MTDSSKDIVEAFTPVKGYEGLYEVSPEGSVRSIAGARRHGVVLKQSENRLGYKRVSLCKDGLSKGHLVHRLVATVFLSNPEKKRCVNHLDGNPRNNHVSNLEWATHGENTKHSFEMLGRKSWNKGRLGVPSCVSKKEAPTYNKTHCKWGHEYTPENSGTLITGYRYCMKCNAIASKRSKQKMKLAQLNQQKGD